MTYLKSVMDLVEQEKLQILDIAEEDREHITSLPRKIGSGEAESIALCRRLSMVFVTHDRKAANFCDRAEVRCLHFRTLVNILQKRGLLTSEHAQQTLE